MGENVDTRELELKILEVKTNKLVERIDILAKKLAAKEIGNKEAIEELESFRKELIDCVVLQLGTPVIGPLFSIQTIKVISQVDDLLASLKIISIFGTGS